MSSLHFLVSQKERFRQMHERQFAKEENIADRAARYMERHRELTDSVPATIKVLLWCRIEYDDFKLN